MPSPSKNGLSADGKERHLLAQPPKQLNRGEPLNGDVPPEDGEEPHTGPPSLHMRPSRSFASDNMKAKFEERVLKMKLDMRIAIWPSRMETWDIIMFTGLIYTCIVTPVQVAFLPSTPLALFVLNRIVDVILMMDMIVAFFVVRVEESKGRKVWITDLPTIRWRILKTNFVPDFLGLLSSAVEIIEYGAVSLGDASAAKLTRFLRFFRLLRILRMARVFVVLDVLLRKFEDLAGSQQVRFVTMELMKWIIKIVLLAHVIGCIWGFLLSIEESSSDSAMSWLKAYENNFSWHIDRDQDVGWLYLLSLYWAFTTLLTVGYGDILPWTLPEHVVCMVIIAAGGIIWPMLMASVCSMIDVNESSRLGLSLRMHTLAGLCNDRNLPPDMRQRLRHFLVRKWRLKKSQDQQELIRSLAPILQAEVALGKNSQFFDQVRFLRPPSLSDDLAPPTPPSLHTKLAERLEIFTISEDGWVVPHRLEPHITTVRIMPKAQSAGPVGQASGEVAGSFILEGHLLRGRSHVVAPLTFLDSGLAEMGGRLFVAPSCWHEDMVLSSPLLRNPQVARALTVCSIYVLSLEDLASVVRDGLYAETKKRIRIWTITLAMNRLLRKAMVAKLAHDAERSKSTPEMNLVQALGKVFERPKRTRKDPSLQMAANDTERGSANAPWPDMGRQISAADAEKPITTQTIFEIVQRVHARQAELEETIRKLLKDRHTSFSTTTASETNM